jgi:hypothetical protein
MIIGREATTVHVSVYKLILASLKARALEEQGVRLLLWMTSLDIVGFFDTQI